MHIHDPVVPEFDAHLPDRLQKRQRFDVTDRSTDFDQTDIGIASTFPDAFLNFIGDVRDDLHSRTEVVAAPFLGNDALVNPAGCEIAVPSGSCAHETLIVAEIKIRLGAVFSYEYLAVLERAHRARVDVEVGIQLDHADRQSARLQNRTKAGRSDPLTQGGHNATSDEYIRCHVRALKASGNNKGSEQKTRFRAFLPTL